jgi:hypothetical protein
MLIELCYDPKVQGEQPKPTVDRADQEQADEKLEKQEEAARTGDDRPKGE